MDSSEGIGIRGGFVTKMDIWNKVTLEAMENAHYYGAATSPTILYASVTQNTRGEYESLRNSNPDLLSPGCNCAEWQYTPGKATSDIGTPTDTIKSAPINSYARCQVTSINDRNDSIIRFDDLTAPFDMYHYWDDDAVTLYLYNDTASIFVLYGTTGSVGALPTDLYNCTTTVTGPYGPIDVSWALATAITPQSGSTYTKHGVRDSSTYGKNSAWALNQNFTSLARPSEVDVASTIAQFSLLCLAAMDQGADRLPSRLPQPADMRKKIHGRQPYRMSKLRVNWFFAIPIVCTVLLLQLVFLLLTIFFANDTVVKDESHLCSARLLAPIVRMTGTGGSLLQIKEIVKALPDDTFRLRYGWNKAGEVKRVRVFEGDSKVS
jgi:hypothetical protein